MARFKVSLITWLGICLMLGALVLNRTGSFSTTAMAERAGHRLDERAQKLNNVLTAFLVDQPDALVAIGHYRDDRIGLYVYSNDSLILWNNSQIPLPPGDLPGERGIVHLNNGYYLFVQANQEGRRGLALCLIKPDYELQNNYLNNDFKGWTGISGDVDLDTTRTGGVPVSLNGRAIFWLKGAESDYYKPAVDNLCLAVFMTGFLLLLAGLLLRITNGLSHREWWITVLSVLLLRAIMIGCQWPQFFYRAMLYDVRLFGNAQSLHNAFLGDILLNAFSFLFLVSAVYFHFRGRLNAWVQWGLLPLLILELAGQFNHTIVSLVSNSTLNFDFLNIFNVSFPVLIALGAMTVTSLALFMALRKFAGSFRYRNWTDFPMFLVVILFICLVLHLVSKASLFENYWLLVFAAIVYLTANFIKVQQSVVLGLQILLMSAITSVILNIYIERNQKQDLALLSMSLGERQDPILENEFSRLPQRIAADQSIGNLINILPETREAIEQLLRQKYFNEYFNRYEVGFCLFNSRCEPLLNPKNPVLMNEGFFDEQIRYNSDSTTVDGLFFVKAYKNNARYIGKIVLGDKRLYVLLEPKQFQELGSFPDLLLDRSQQKHEKLKNFSYAVYRSHQKTSNYGNYNYPLFLPDSVTLASSDPGQVHRLFSIDEGTHIIISRSAKTWVYFFTFNSYLLLYFLIITYCFYLVYAFLFTSVFANASLTRRIQTIIILLLLLGMSAIGYTSARLVINQFEAENQKQLREKTEIIINELLGQFKAQTLFEPVQKEFVNLRLNEYARLFNTDISLFTSNGTLFNTSQPRLYDLGLSSTLGNPWAMYQLKHNLSSAVSVNEKAGSLSFISLYTPMYNGNQQLVGFINLPYFARQNDLVNELSGIISALINVYVILFVVSIIGGLIFSGYITKPLRLIQQQISNISLGKKNEKIVWTTNDEIGRLVTEYNDMLLKLEHSASLLAQNERESAWREMAKQVAHEIKNPLTPMKLNLQYLQHLMKNDLAAFHEKFEKASGGIIDQINALASIATEFSNFAKLPQASLQPINLAGLVNTSLLIFENQQIAISNHITGAEIWVKGDPDQCLRVFTNILSNAVQAVADTPQPVIGIGVEFSDAAVVVSVRDNGCGIAEDLQPRIFTPNFTTKSTGSGLGLAMVKNIMLSFGGNVWFVSGKQGTTFYLEFVREAAGA